MKTKQILMRLFILIFSVFVLCGVARSAEENYTLEITYDMNGGVVTVNDTQFTSGEVMTFTASSELTCRAIPNEGYKLKQWRVVLEGSDTATLTSDVITFFENSRNIHLTAEFESITHNVTASTEGQGSAVAEPNSNVTEGVTVNLTATPKEGYQFVEWRSEDVDITNAQSSSEAYFTMPDKNVTATAVFEEITVTGISLNSDDAKKEYTVGDELDLNNLILTVTKSDGTTETVNVTEDMISGFDSSQAGQQTITVTYAGFTDSYEVEVNEKEVDPTPTPSPTPTDPTDTDASTTENATSQDKSAGHADKVKSSDTGDHRNLTTSILTMLVSLGGLVLTSSWIRRKGKYLRR